MVMPWLFVFMGALVAAVASTAALPPCSLLNADGTVRDDATYAWTVHNLTVDTAPALSFSGGDDVIGPRNVSFVVSSPALHEIAACRGPRYTPEDDVWQSCQPKTTDSSSSADSVWLTFSTDFLITNYVQLNQTWICQAGERRWATEWTGVRDAHRI